MKALIYPIVNDENVRADTVDICYNIKQIENPIEKLRDNAGVTCSGNYYTIPASETPEAKLQREKYENNYEKLENFRRYKLVILSQKLKKNLRKIWKIYNHHVKEFEQRDDEYRKRLNKLYDVCTDTLDKYLDARTFLDSVTWEFIKPLVGVAAFTVVAIFVPEVAIACLVLPVIGCITLASVPKQYVPKWLQGAKDDSDAIVNIVKGGPKSIVEAIGQGLMDEVQTPQGVASVSGTVAGMALSGPLSKKFGPKIKAARGEVDVLVWSLKRGLNPDLIKELVASGVKCNIDDIVGIVKTADGKIVWLEKGNSKAGLEHILSHADQFATQGIAKEKIPDFIMYAVENGTIVGKQRTRPIYEVMYEGKLYRVAISIGKNGFIVGANPKSMPK